MSHHVVYVVMAGLIALTKVKTAKLTKCAHQASENGHDHSALLNEEGSSAEDRMAIYVRDSRHELKARVYGSPSHPGEMTLPLANHRLEFTWRGRKTFNPLDICPWPEEVQRRRRNMFAPETVSGNGQENLKNSDKKPVRGRLPRNPDEAKAFVWIPSIECALPKDYGDVKIDPYCVDPKLSKSGSGSIRRIVGAQVILDQGELCTGHLVELGGLVPELYFKSEDFAKTKEAPVLRFCADVMVLRLVAPPRTDTLFIQTCKLPKLNNHVEHEIQLSDQRPVVVSLTNQSRPVARVPRVASHFKLYGQLLERPTSSMFLPRVESDQYARYATAQPGYDFDGIEGITPPSVDNRAMCPFTEIPPEE